ncbi:MAG TPA: nucleotidyltransferase family protein [Anaerolineales bacterium]|nr:nucleotidyltransferase family protein [Anaerolineales bacterium]
MIAAVVLAAGRSRRMGRPKLLLPLADGRTVLAHVVDSLRAGGASPVVAVVETEPVAQEAEKAGALISRSVDEGERDMLGSIQRGLRALQDQDVAGAMILPGDMPFIRAETIRRLVETFEEDPHRLVAPSYDRHRGHPACIPRERWPDVQALAPPSSLRDYLADHSREIRYVVVDDPGILQDVDHPDEYETAIGSTGGR